MIQGSFRRLMMRSGGSQLSDAAAFLASYGPFGMVMDFTDSSIAINDEANTLDYSSVGTVQDGTGALLGPGSKLTYTAPSAKLTEQADGYLSFQAHNLYLNSAAPANQSITVLSGGTYAVTITGSVSVTASGAATGTWTVGTNTFTAATGTLTLGSTSGSGTVHVRRTPSVSTYVATTGSIKYDLPYVYSNGVRTKILPEPAATNLALRSNDFTNASWTKSNLTAAMTATGPDNVANSASTLTATAGNATALQAITSGSASRLTSVYIKRRTGTGNIDLTQDNGSTWTTQTVTSSWTRVSIVAVTSTNPTVGIRIVTSGDEVDVWCYQHETGTAATSPIITYGAAVTRAADNITLATSLWPYQQNLSIHIAWDGGPDVTSWRLGSLYGAANARYWDLYRNGSVLASYSNHTNAGGGGVLSVPAPADFTGSHQYAARFKDSNYKSATDGTLGSADTDIVINVVATTLALGAYPAGSSVGNPGITRIAIVTRSWSDAELQAVST